MPLFPELLEAHTALLNTDQGTGNVDGRLYGYLEGRRDTLLEEYCREHGITDEETVIDRLNDPNAAALWRAGCIASRFGKSVDELEPETLAACGVLSPGDLEAVRRFTARENGPRPVESGAAA